MCYANKILNWNWIDKNVSAVKQISLIETLWMNEWTNKRLIAGSQPQVDTNFQTIIMCFIMDLWINYLNQKMYDGQTEWINWIVRHVRMSDGPINRKLFCIPAHKNSNNNYWSDPAVLSCNIKVTITVLKICDLSF